MQAPENCEAGECCINFLEWYKHSFAWISYLQYAWYACHDDPCHPHWIDTKRYCSEMVGAQFSIFEYCFMLFSGKLNVFHLGQILPLHCNPMHAFVPSTNSNDNELHIPSNAAHTVAHYQAGFSWFTATTSLLTKICQTTIGVREWTRDCNNVRQYDTVTHPPSNFDGDLVVEYMRSTSNYTPQKTWI